MSSILLLAMAAFGFILIAVCTAGFETVVCNNFNQRFPPISDEEFVARCRPGVNPDVALRVRRIVAEQLGVEYARIYPSQRFVEDLGAD